MPAGDSYAEIENAISSNHDDTLLGNDQANIFIGLNGQDRINGGAGNDYLLGGDGDDTLVGGNGINILTGGADNDRFILNPREGIDIITDFNAAKDLILLPNDLEFSQLSFAQADNSTDTVISFVNSDQVIGTLINPTFRELYYASKKNHSKPLSQGGFTNSSENRVIVKSQKSFSV